jgi:hypothetical protein
MSEWLRNRHTVASNKPGQRIVLLHVKPKTRIMEVLADCSFSGNVYTYEEIICQIEIIYNIVLSFTRARAYGIKVY